MNNTEDFTLTTNATLALEVEPHWCNEFARSLFHSFVQAPATGVAQIIDRLADTNLEEGVNFQPACKPRKFLSKNWHAQQLGALAGGVVPLVFLHQSVSRLSSAAFGTLERGASLATKTARLGGEAFVTGALFDGVLRPVTAAEKETFVESRLNNAIAGGATFATLATSALGLRNLSCVKNSALGSKFLSTEFGSTVVAGVPAGFVNAHSMSLLHKGKFADNQHVSESMYSFALMGASFYSAKVYFLAPVWESQPGRAPNKEFEAQSKVSDENAAAKSLDRAAPSLPESDSTLTVSETARLQAKLDTMLEPVTSRLAVLDEPHHASRRLLSELENEEKKLDAELDDYRASPNGTEVEFEKLFRDRIDKLDREIKHARDEHFRIHKEVVNSPGYRSLVEERGRIRSTDEYRAVEIARDLSRGDFPSGRFLLRYPGEEPVRLNVQDFDYRNSRLYPWDFKKLSVEHVSRVIDSIDGLNNRPRTVELDTSEVVGAEYGSSPGAQPTPRFIRVCLGDVSPRGLQHLLEHESGHLLADRQNLLRSSCPESGLITRDYEQGLRATAPLVADRLGVEATPQWVDKYVEHMVSLPKDYTPPVTGPLFKPVPNPRYRTCFSEVFAELFSLRAAERRQNAAGEYPTYAELIDAYTKEIDPLRARLLSGFEPLYGRLSKSVFDPLGFRAATAGGGTAAR